MSDYVEEYKNDLDEIVFENRNKSYGAYNLRKSYRNLLTKAVVIGVLLFTMIIAVPFVMTKIEQMNGVEEKKVDLTLSNLDEEAPEEEIFEEIKQEEEPPPPPPEEEQIEVIQNVVPEPKKTPKVETPPPPIDVQKKTVTGLKPQEGVKKPNATPPPPPPKNPGKGKAVAKKVDNKIYKSVDQDSDFPGGIDKFRNKVFEELQESEILEDLEEDVQFTITFVVEKDGTTSGFKASGGPKEFRDEAINAIKSVKTRFKPAKVNGKPVRSYYRFPFSFESEF